jgi:hypothetical protein
MQHVHEKQQQKRRQRQQQKQMRLLGDCVLNYVKHLGILRRTGNDEHCGICEHYDDDEWPFILYLNKKKS